MTDPFQKDSGELLTLDTKDEMNDDVVETTRNSVKTAQQQHDVFVNAKFFEKISAFIPPRSLALCSKYGVHFI